MNTGVYAAEYGWAAGGVINSVTKSGTNQLLRRAYFYDREINWNAFNTYTKNTTAVYANGGTISSSLPPIPSLEDVRKIYGFTLGGGDHQRHCCSGSASTISTRASFLGVSAAKQWHDVLQPAGCSVAWLGDLQPNHGRECRIPFRNHSRPTRTTRWTAGGLHAGGAPAGQHRHLRGRRRGRRRRGRCCVLSAGRVCCRTWAM